jgi:hypothetical protein
MSKRSRRKRKRTRRQSAARQFPWPWLAIGGVAVAIAIALVVVQPWSGDEPSATPLVTGSPRLMVDQTTVDEGYVKYNVPIRTTFRLSNVGDEVLQIVDAPQVRLVEGC